MLTIDSSAPDLVPGSTPSLKGGSGKERNVLFSEYAEARPFWPNSYSAQYEPFQNSYTDLVAEQH